jgi:hypothetical protein
LRNPVVLLLIAVSAALGVTGVARRTPNLPESDVAGRPVQQHEDGYTSSDTCRSCHPSQFDSWHASFHRTMTQVATPQTAIPNFDGQTIADVQGKAEPPERRPRIDREVTMITGSHNQQIFWYATGHDRVVGQLPAAYLVQEQRWIPRRMAVLHPPSQQPLSETGHWNSTCIACHATHGKSQFDTPFGSRPIQMQSVQTTAAEFGIACESCHGPGLGVLRRRG